MRQFLAKLWVDVRCIHDFYETDTYGLLHCSKCNGIGYCSDTEKWQKIRPILLFLIMGMEGDTCTRYALARVIAQATWPVKP